jgi:hypothetical protein
MWGVAKCTIKVLFSSLNRLVSLMIVICLGL